MQIEIPQINQYSGTGTIGIVLKVLNSAFQEYQPIKLSFCNCKFISSVGVALLAGLKYVRDTKELLTDVDFQSIDPNVEKVLSRAGFLGLFGLDTDVPSGNTLPLLRQTTLDKDGILVYIDSEILRRDMPKMSDDLHKEIRSSFFEIFSNVFCHSKSPIGGLVCGQVYPKKREIQIVFYDAGIGIARCICNHESSIKKDWDAIEWAVKRGTSTLSSRDHSRGLGLFLLQQFAKNLLYCHKTGKGVVLKSSLG
jgi:anti-sigma regulatory factor (Ser/Thr protein kinase)